MQGLEAQVGLPGDGAETLRDTGFIEVGPRYFATLRTPVLRGREFDAHDDLAGAPVAVVNEALAAMLWPEGNAIGADVVVDGRRCRVVGIVADVPLHRRDESQRPYVYTAFWQDPEQVDARLQVRIDGDAAAALPRLMTAVSSVDPEVPISEAMTLSRQLEGLVRPQRMAAAAVGYAAALAVALSALGLYAALVCGAGVLASIAPALRAARVAPARALRPR